MASIAQPCSHMSPALTSFTFLFSLGHSLLVLESIAAPFCRRNNGAVPVLCTLCCHTALHTPFCTTLFCTDVSGLATSYNTVPSGPVQHATNVDDDMSITKVSPVQYCTTLAVVHVLCKVAHRFLLSVCTLQGIAQFCTEPLVRFVYLCTLPYTSVLSVLFRCYKLTGNSTVCGHSELQRYIVPTQ